MNASATLSGAVAATLLVLAASSARASSHMDAPLITLDPAANTTDVYAFRTDRDGVEYLTVALGVSPHEEPGIGPNKYNFDDNVLYEIHLALGDDVASGRATLSYQFEFETTFRRTDTILQSYLGVISSVGDESQNLVQRYTVSCVDRRPRREHTLHRRRARALLEGIVPPNNQGIATPLYNELGGEGPAKAGVAAATLLDPYTQQSIFSNEEGYRVFAGQRDDGFFGDILSIFDLLALRNPGVDSQGGFNIHMMALEIPVSELGGTEQIVGAYATTSRRKVTVLRDGIKGPKQGGPWVQVARQGNPLFNEGLVAIADKDLYNRTSPETDQALFARYALEPELAALINALLLGGSRPEIATGRSDIAGIFIPDVIKVDLSTGPVRLAGGGPSHPTTPDDEGFSRLSIFGGDVLTSAVQDPFGLGVVPGGWPNGRRFGDDVVDIAVNALLSDLRVQPPVVNTFDPGDGVPANDAVYNKVFPFESTPQNGRNHTHP